MIDNNDSTAVPMYSENDYCPICGELAIGEKKHICPEHILDEICEIEIAKSEEINDDEKSYGEKLADADFILNYYNEYDDDDDDDLF